ncbi:MAG TPA: ABC transporter substrate-binding protein [Stellaceae bacterium]|nr:ABC transporter substrate-binding protein [Stellaceae bacterium]
MRASPIFAALAFAVGLGSAHGAEPVKIRIGWIAPPDASLFMWGKQGIAKHEGTSYTLDFVHFQGSPPIITALAVDEVDIAPLSYPSFTSAVGNAALGDLRIVADMFQDGVEGWYTNQYMVLNDSPIKTVQDLKGKIYVTNAIGAAPDIALRAMLRKHGLDDKKDITIIEGAFPNMRALLADHKVDIIMTPPPFSEETALRSIARTLFTMKDAVGVSQLLVLGGRKGFLDKNRAAVVDYMEDFLRELHWYSDPANHEEAVKIVSAFTKTPPQVWQSWLYTKGDSYRDPNGRPNIAAFQSNVDMLHDLGFPNSAVDVSKYVDLSLMDEAAKRLR